MLYLLSPAKTLDFESPVSQGFADQEFTLPRFPKEAIKLSRQLKKLKPAALQDLMDISVGLATLNHARFKAFSAEVHKDNSRAALLAFNGDVYEGLRASTLSAEDVAWAQGHIRMLSGLYGVLRPLDLMQPYRLEMGTPFVNTEGRNIYAVWTKKSASLLNKDLALIGANSVINLASDEYFKSVNLKILKANVIQPVFQERKKNDAARSGNLAENPFKVVSFNAKRARGLMARYAIDGRIKNAEALKEFSIEGYRFEPSVSSETRWLFRREI
jgi:uncharacterized protein